MNHNQEQDAKQRILLAARKCFAAYGFDRTSVRQICEEAGVNVALVSYHFGGKENLFYALFEAYFPKKEEAERMKVEDPVGAVKLLIEEITRMRIHYPELISLLQQEIALMSPRIPIIRQHAFPIWERLREVLQAGKDQKQFDFESLDQAMLFVLGSLFIHKQWPYFEPIMSDPQPNFEASVSYATFFILRGLGCSDS
ncbi:TetR/AcrR family transcriptional regulator [Marinicrinis sediminis]|uniref:TetR/AcrR family transcriptional regulator n=1 Tax=Marinicrinis sediminis TaxID=1652465 RepID=A0ABW5RD37_9BACL